MMGMGSIIGTGVFVSLGIAAGVTGPSMILALIVAALLATANGLSAAQLAAHLPVSGGTYEYGYRLIHPTLGFTAGWMFLCAKSASAATAALGFAGYTLNLLDQQGSSYRIPLAVSCVLVLTLVVYSGIQRSNRLNLVTVSVTLLSLTAFVLGGIPLAARNLAGNLTPFFLTEDPAIATRGFLEACALLFVAYTGYGRITTMGEEVVEPRTTIPRAIILTLAVSSLLYVCVAVVSIGSVGANAMAAATAGQMAPLEVIARRFDIPGIAPFVALGAVTAMLGVLLNLILGLSRVMMAMSRRGDLPGSLARVDPKTGTPQFAVLTMGGIVALLALTGNVKTTWSFSAFAVLIYYALTHLAALRLPSESRRFPQVIAWAGLLGCLSLAFWVEPQAWIMGLICLAGGLALRALFRRLSTRAGSES